MKKLLGLFVCVLLAGCNSSSDSGGKGSVVIPPVTPEAKVTINGLLQTANFSSATVCFDVNDNYVCDNAEPKVNVNADGTFTISNDVSAPLVAEVTPAARVANKLIFSTPKGESVISALTTIIKGERDRHANKNLEDIAIELGLGNQDPFSKNNNLSGTIIKAEAAINKMIAEAQRVLGNNFKFSNSLMALLMNEIVTQISNGGNFDNVDVGQLPQTPSDMEKEQEDIIKNQPIYKTILELVANGAKFDFYMIRKEGFNIMYLMKQTIASSGYIHGQIVKLTDKVMPQDDPNGDAMTWAEISQLMKGATVVNLSGTNLQASPIFNRQLIQNFPAGSLGYLLDMAPAPVKKATLPSINNLRLLATGVLDLNNPIFNGKGWYIINRQNGIQIAESTITCMDYKLILNMDGSNTFSYVPLSDIGEYDNNNPFIVGKYNRGGKFESIGTGNDTVIYFYNNDGNIFVYFVANNKPILTEFISTTATIPNYHFNETALKHISDNWNLQQ